VDELVEDDVIGKLLRQDGKASIELNATRGRGAAPKRALVPDAQSSGREAVLSGQRGQAFGEEGARGSAVEAFGRDDRLAATVPGALDPSESPPDPVELRDGDPPGLFERNARRDGDPNAPRGPDGQAYAAGPAAFLEKDGPDAVDLDGPCRTGGRRAGRSGQLNLRN
jgi:hypothetical protein